MRTLIFLLLIWCSCPILYPQDCSCPTRGADMANRVQFTIDSIAGTDLILNAKDQVLPGTLVGFKTNYYVVYQQLSNGKYLAKFHRGVDTSAPAFLEIGAKSETTGLISPNASMGSCYWSSLRNLYLRSKRQDDGLWLYLENGMSMIDGKLPQTEQFMLSVRTPPIKGYFCLLEIRSNTNEVVVYYPNDKVGTVNKQEISHKGVINLTYTKEQGHIPPFINLFLAPADNCRTIFVAIISTKARPLTDFLPPNLQSNYLTWNGKPIQAWEIGPGFYAPGITASPSVGLTRLPGDSWAAARLEVESR